MDEVGLLVTSVEEDGRLKFRKVGGVDDRILPGTAVVLYNESTRVEGVIGVAPPHFQQQQQQVTWQDLYIDVGASSRQEVEAMVLTNTQFKCFLFPGTAPPNLP